MSEKSGVVIFGIGPNSKTIYYACQHSRQYRIAAFAANQQYINEPNLCGLDVVAFEDVQQQYPPESFDMLVVNVGAVAGTTSRKNMFLRAKDKGYSLINYIDAQCSIADDVVMGENNIVMYGAHVGPSGVMGDNNFIRENMYLGHDFHIGDHNFLGPGCNIGGYCRIGDLNFVGMGSTTINNIKIGNHNLIGAGALVIKDVSNNGKHVGNPARKLSDHPSPE